MNKQIEALKMAIEYLRVCHSMMATNEYSDDFYTDIQNAIDFGKEALAEAEKQEPVAWMEEYQSCKVNGDERLCHSDKVFRLVQLLASQLSECQSLCAKYAEETVKNGEQKLKEVTAIKEALEKAEKQEWQSLSEQEIKDVLQSVGWIFPESIKTTDSDYSLRGVLEAYQKVAGAIRAIEAKLKEKNRGRL